MASQAEIGLIGLGVMGQNLALNIADQLDAGMVGINQGIVSNVAAPFGGVKASGLGREGSGEGLEEYQEIRFYNLGRRGA